MTILYALLALLLPSQPGEAETCTGEYGKPVEFLSCKVVDFPDFRIESKGGGRPDPEVPMFCKDYEARDERETVTFSHCSTGVLGGESRFTLSGTQYVVDRDVPAKCLDGRRVRGLRIWKDSPDLPPYRVRNADRHRSFKCEQ